MKNEIKNKLICAADEKYRDFNASLTPDNPLKYLGVKIPVLDDLSKEIIKKDPYSYLEFEPEFFEEKLLQGMVIGGMKLEFERKLNLVQSYVSKIDSWGVCDTFVSRIKFVKQNREEFLKFIEPYFSSEKEFERRFFLVTLKTYYMEEKYLNYIFNKVEDINTEGYYVKMGIGWLVAECFIKYPEKTLDFLQKTSLEKNSYNKIIRKIRESLRIDKNTKDKLKKIFK